MTRRKTLTERGDGALNVAEVAALVARWRHVVAAYGGPVDSPYSATGWARAADTLEAGGTVQAHVHQLPRRIRRRLGKNGHVVSVDGATGEVTA